jgi:hypothetical protein
MGGSASKEPEVEKESKGEDAENLAAEQDKHKNVKLTKKDKEDVSCLKMLLFILNLFWFIDGQI